MTGQRMDDADVVLTATEAAALEREPLLILEPIAAFLDDAGLGAGPLDVAPIGGGHSNVTYELRRGDARFVLRRPPRGPLPPSAHDMLREARLLTALAPTGVRVPAVLAICADESLIGAPFYVMELIDGDVLVDAVPPAFASTEARSRIAEEVVDAIAELHAVDWAAAGLSELSRPSGYLERQVRRFRDLLERNATRPLPGLERIADWLSASIPETRETTVVHGEYRVGNTLFGGGSPPRLAAILDWELAALGDPLADVGYMTATWASPDDPPNPLRAVSEVTCLPGFPDRDAVARLYAERTGRSVDAIGWYRVLALWKAAIFFEGNYKRYLAGSTDDPYLAQLGDGVPVLARMAEDWTRDV